MRWMEHFLLDVGVFLILGLLYEPRLSWCYPLVLLTSALAIGLGLLVMMMEV